MLTVVGLHCRREVLQGIVHRHIHRHIHLRRSRPEHHDTCTALPGLKAADILAQLLHHVPARSAVLHIVAVKTAGIILVEGSLHGHYGLQLVLNRIDILCPEHLGIHRALKGILRIHIPRSEDDVVERSKWNDVAVMKLTGLFALANADLVVLRH